MLMSVLQISKEFIMEKIGKKGCRSGSITSTQKEVLAEYMKNHPQLNSGHFSKNFTHKDARRLWGEVTEILNACPNGPVKDWVKWRKAWQDLKKNAKAKASGISNQDSKSDGEKASQKDSGVISTEIVEIDGHIDVPESVVTFDCGLLFTDGNKYDSGLSPTGSKHDVEDHQYCADTDSDKEASISVATQVKSRKEHLTKPEELKSSVGVSQREVPLRQEKEDYRKIYYEKKIEILLRAEERRKQYEERKILLLEQQINNQKILEELRELKKLIVDKK